ncbi:putative ABC transport system ATP-binding protein [Kineosphaera limosa]|uniref:Putative ABC transporter ATP-binding protein n=1 Tax=Kineosphaera limosa NBRC 100340 TaxID=1184609 RepID=K6X106_9MICO|nr:ABC transporter ATP-binding protein [Kineosphaera limosa]NYE02012.1 putative ABC transport system ATP-binding protein [Kineosphaera limosa]GAB98057.1 putative ABC transporter ATP-binding protein [Kineosphaera limosa NBRC 100340]
MTALVTWNQVTKRYRPDGRDVLNGIDLTVERGDYISIRGASGSGKTTLLNLLGMVDRPTTGTRTFDGVTLEDLSRGKEALTRRRIAFVFQEFYLIDDISTLDNVALSLVYRGVPGPIRNQRALEELSAVGLDEYADTSVLELSGGQRQRIALARALVSKPDLLLCDEPTGSLDPASAQLVMDILATAHTSGTTVIVVTHSPEVALAAQRRWTVEAGALIESPAP